MRCGLLLLVISFAVLTTAFAGDGVVIKVVDFPDGGSVEIPATDSIVFDTQGHIFSKAHGEGFGPPETIALHYIGDSVKGYYSMPYSSRGKTFWINAENLTPRGNPTFPGFEAGASAFLMVGREVPEGSLDMGVFANQWTLNISVKQ